MLRAKVLIISLFVMLFASYITCFSEESIFEDEDIYRMALPPPNATGTTVPGTKWCGPGNTAANYNDLGKHRDTDTCCREHDHCEMIIEPTASLHGITNSGMFPIMKCSCEQKFINCLQAVNSMVSNTLGHIYFGATKQCVEYGFPIVNCKQYMEGTFRKRCIRYKINKKRPQIWQLYDIPFYTTSSVNKPK
ncbi:phospholipase A2 [Musca domestica]|uniref:phospholipase A2 n=1 Tax=Musca domestica TaxID=7370 RepID=A0A9J7CJX2_MUSDO|nr:phospholipase A2 [Musca domestica]XP_011296328.2 phospholipase A2 [Musca domestica]